VDRGAPGIARAGEGVHAATRGAGPTAARSAWERGHEGLCVRRPYRPRDAHCSLRGPQRNTKCAGFSAATCDDSV